ncbi:MAG: type II toxin-antitoxin system VapC family toxin [Acidobacteriaceae bacterium]
MSLVLDSSVVIAWVYNDESTPAVKEIESRVLQHGAFVPSIWRLEVANVLEMSVRKRRNNSAFRNAVLADLALLPITIDPETERQAWGPILTLAEQHRLTLYDAAYLELAIRRGLALATLDKDLRSAARKEKVVLLGV